MQRTPPGAKRRYRAGLYTVYLVRAREILARTKLPKLIPDQLPRERAKKERSQ